MRVAERVAEQVAESVWRESEEGRYRRLRPRRRLP